MTGAPTRIVYTQSPTQSQTSYTFRVKIGMS